MIVITLNPQTLEYLKFIFESHCEKGLPVAELGVAAATWNCIYEAKEITKEGVTSIFHPDQPKEEEVKHIQGPVSVVVNGDMTMPLPLDSAKEMLELP